MSKKEPGWCEREDVEHSWENGPALATSPPIYTRYCHNCGQGQRMYPSQWEDYPPKSQPFAKLQAAAVNLMAAIDDMHGRGETFTTRVSIAAADMKKALKE